MGPSDLHIYPIDASKEAVSISHANLEEIVASGKLGNSTLKIYRWGAGRCLHGFCSNCAARLFVAGDSEGMGKYTLVNVRCLDGLEKEGLELKELTNPKNLAYFDGRDTMQIGLGEPEHASHW